MSYSRVMSDLLTYAIGDIHGCSDLLVRLLRNVRDHASGRPYRLVFLGDYIDRGPDSAGVVHIVRELQKVDAESVICLMGNHEDMLLQCVADLGKTLWWLENGGGEAMRSFRVSSPRSIPKDVLEWMAGLRTSYEDERRIYVHAGLAPGRPLGEQNDRDRLWIREPFLSSDFDFGKHVVHGHTPLTGLRPDVRHHRTNLDTAAVFGGPLTAGVFTNLQDEPIAFLRAFWSDGEPSPSDN
jgi:serine/threonine protein phosphatase 1